jgi:hypothetical protein
VVALRMWTRCTATLATATVLGLLAAGCAARRDPGTPRPGPSWSASSPPVAGYSPTCTNPAGPLPDGQGLTVSGNRLLSSGAPFVVHAVILEGLQDSPELLAAAARKGPLRQIQAGYQAYGPAELTAIRCFGANTVRIHLGQPVSDPQNQLYSASYLQQFVGYVKEARAQGLAVIVDLQDESLSGEQNALGNPTDATVRAWQKVAPLLANIPGVMLEPFNEPILSDHTANAWQTWLHGGTAYTYHHQRTMTMVGVQQLVNTIRSAGADNPIILMGLLRIGGGWTLAGLPPVADTDHQLVYAIHFPPSGDPVGIDQPIWDQAFGTAAASVPVIITAFNVSPEHHCGPTSTVTATSLVRSYLPAHQVGLAGWAFDNPGTIFQTTYTGPLTTLDHMACATTSGTDDPSQTPGAAGGNSGDGELLYKAYSSEGGRR